MHPALKVLMPLEAEQAALRLGRNVFEELGTGFTLLAFGVASPAIEAFRRASKSLQIPLKVVQDSFGADRLAYESRLILVRPDQYVAWAGEQMPGDAAGLLQTAAGTA